MRLIDIKRYINIAYENFNPKFSNNGSYYYLENVQQVKKAIQALRDAGILEFSETKFDMTDQILSFMMERCVLDGNQYKVYKDEFSKIQAAITVMYQWINRYVPTEETETIINIKLPQINTLSDFAASANCIKKALSQVVSEAGGNIKVKQLDHGSYWLIIDVGTIEAVVFVGLLVSAAYRIAMKVINTLKAIEELKSLRLDNQLKEYQLDERKFIQSKAQEEAKKINHEQFGKTKGEDLANFNEREGRICVSIEELVKIIRAGGEIHQSLEAPKTVSELYPKYNTSLSFTPIALLSKQEGNEIKEDDSTNDQFGDRTGNKQEQQQ